MCDNFQSSAVALRDVSNADLDASSVSRRPSRLATQVARRKHVLSYMEAVRHGIDISAENVEVNVDPCVLCILLALRGVGQIVQL